MTEPELPTDPTDPTDPADINRAAALAVCGAAHNTQDAKQLLDILGIWPPTKPTTVTTSINGTTPHLVEDRRTQFERAARAEREKAARAANPRPPAPAREHLPCGTAAAYRRHLRNAETPCPECQIAAAANRLANKKAAR